MKIEHSISIHFACTIIEAAKRKGLDYQYLLQSANLNKELLKKTQLRITPEQFSRLMQAMWILGDDEFLGMASQPARQGLFTLMAKQVVNCQDLHCVYRRIKHFYNLVTDGIILEFKTVEQEVHFSMVLNDPSLDPDYSLREFLMLVWHRFPSWLVGQRIPLKRIQFDYPKPQHLAEYRLMYPCPAEFEQPNNCLVFDSSILNATIVQTPKALRSYLRRAPLDWFVRQAYYQVFTQRVVTYLQQNDATGVAKMEEIAAKLHLTTRTLRRKLTEEGTSFQELKDNVRRDVAIHYLSQPALPISQISEKLGFSEPTAFTRAFKHWTGVTPKVYRG